MRACYQRGMLILGCGKNSVRFSPPLMIGEDHVDQALDIFEAALSACEAA